MRSDSVSPPSGRGDSAARPRPAPPAAALPGPPRQQPGLAWEGHGRTSEACLEAICSPWEAVDRVRIGVVKDVSRAFLDVQAAFRKTPGDALRPKVDPGSS